MKKLRMGMLLVLVMGASGNVSLALAEEGMAVHYSDVFQGRPTASNEIFDQEGLTAATHKQYPFGTKLKVTNLENGKSVVVTVNDRMRSNNRNLIDITRRAARELDFEKPGRARVSVEPVQ